MGRAIGDLIPYAIGLATSPIAVIAVILMVLSKRGRANATSFVTGYIVGVAGASAVFLAFARLLHHGPSTGSSTSSSIVDLVIGVFLLVLAVRNFRKRPRHGERAVLPKWLAVIDSLKPGKSAVLGTFSPLGGGLNPTNIILIAGAMVELSQAHFSPGADAVAILAFTLIGVSTITIPVIVDWAAGAKAPPLLNKAKAWLTQNNAMVTGALLLVIGIVLITQGARGV